MRVSVNGADLFFDVEGTGLKVMNESMEDKPTIAILHGGPGMDHSYYRPWLSPLAEEAQLIYVDHRGTGRSSKVPLESCTIEQMADDVEGLRKQLGIKRWVVLGNSFGGMWALTYATRYERSLSHLLLVDTTACWRENWSEAKKMAEKWGTPEQRRIYQDMFLGRVHGPEEFRQWFEVMLPLYYHDYREKYHAAIPRGRGAWDVAAYMWKNVMYDYDVRKKITKLKTPTLVVGGRYDWVTPISQSEYLAEKIPNSKLVVFEKSGHSPFVEEQAKFTRVVLDFIRG